MVSRRSFFSKILACASVPAVAALPQLHAEEPKVEQSGMNYYPPPKIIKAEPYTEMPAKFRRPGTSEWSSVNKIGQPPVDSFIEGLCLDKEGNIWIIDVPFGRLFKVSPNREWTQVAEWDGEPGGMALHPNGKFFITDYKQGLLNFDPKTNKLSTFLGRKDSERFKGLNDLTFAMNGDIYFTDQGQTGLHDQTGRVYRLRPDGHLDLLISTGISPNGLVLHPNERVLFVSMTRDNAVWRIPLFPDGTTGKVGRFCSFYGVSGPDSLAIDEEANLFIPHASLGCVFVMNPHGEPIARIVAPKGRTTTNLKFGGPDRKTVYITQSDTGNVWTAKWHIPGRKLYWETAS